MKIGPVEFPSSGSIAGVTIIVVVVAGGLIYASNNVGPVKALIGPR